MHVFKNISMGELINTTIKERKKDMAMLGTKERPIIVRVKTQERADEIAQICDKN